LRRAYPDTPENENAAPPLAASSDAYFIDDDEAI
jgi:hypothetical protein